MNVVPNLILRLNLSISESQCKKLSIKLIMDDYMTLNMTTYTGDKQQQYATETKVNKEDHREVMTANLETHNINRISLGTSEKHPQKKTA